MSLKLTNAYLLVRKASVQRARSCSTGARMTIVKPSSLHAYSAGADADKCAIKVAWPDGVKADAEECKQACK